MPPRSRAAALVLAVTFALLTGSLFGVAGAQTSPTTVEPSPPTTEPTTARAPTPSTTAAPPSTAPEPAKVGDSRIEASVAVRFCPRGKGCAGMHIFIDNAAHHFKAEKYTCARRTRTHKTSCR